MLDDSENIYVFIIFIGVILLVKLIKFVFAVYEFILWNNVSVNALEVNLIFRLWFKTVLMILEILCFIGTIMLLTKSAFG